MQDLGYEIDRFPNKINNQFLCPICKKIAKIPKECSNCSAIFCSSCIEGSLTKKSECPVSKCDTKKFPIQKISGALLIMYNNIDVNCRYPDCRKIKKLIEIEEHETNCTDAKCLNYELCGKLVKPEFKEKGVCDLPCYMMSKIKTAKGNNEIIFNELRDFLKNNYRNKDKDNYKLKSDSLIQSNMKQIEFTYNMGTLGNGGFRWDLGCMGAGIELSEGNSKVFLRESAYMFRTVLGDQPFSGGLNYWEIVALPETDNELKIGISTKRNFNYNTAFCDYEFGYAYYGLGQLRQNSNASGSNYGKRFKKNGVLGICLNMIKGTLSFGADGENWGVAFTSDSLKKGPIYAAIALLHCAGCRLISNKPTPEQFLN